MVFLDCASSVLIHHSLNAARIFLLMSAPNKADPKPHSFSPSVARIYGVNAAVVYQHIRWVCVRRGRYQVTKDQLLKIFPYLGRDQLVSALSRLLNARKHCEPALLQRIDEKINPTYSLRGPASTSAQKLHSFDPEMAQAVGLPAAVIYDDLLRWIVKNDETSEEDLEPSHYESPAQWARSHAYIPSHTVKRAFHTLKLAGEIKLCGRVNGRTPVWTIPLGMGKMDRWKQLHKYRRKEKVNKSKPKIVYVPVLADDDFPEKKAENRWEQKPSSGEQNTSSEGQKPSSGEQNTSSKRN